MNEHNSNDSHSPSPSFHPPIPEKKDVKPLLSMIFGISSIVLATLLWCCYGYLLGLPLGITAIILAVLCKKNEVQDNPKYVTAGLITGIIGTVLSVLSILLLILGVGILMMDVF